MNQKNEDLFAKELVYKIDGMNKIHIKKDMPYTNTTDSQLTMDIYYPHHAVHHTPKPAVILVTGYPDPAFQTMTGYKLKETAQYTSWARLIAASGFIAITYANHDPVSDVNTLLHYINDNGASLGIDTKNICLWSCSGNTPNAMFSLMQNQSKFKCAVLCYGYMPDVGESDVTKNAAKEFHFVNPCQQISAADLSLKTPILIVRCGQDKMPNLNASIDDFIISALACNLPLSFINISDAPHAFDIMADNRQSHDTIKTITSFISSNLC